MSSTSLKLGDLISISKGRKALEVLDIPTATSKRYIQINDLRTDEKIIYAEDPSGVEVIPTDICIAWDGANAGTVGYGLSGYIGSTIARLRSTSREQYFSSYIGRYLQTKFSYLNGGTTGATIPHVSKDKLLDLEIPLPPLDEQRRIAVILDKADAIRRKRQESIRLTEEFLRSTFLEMFGDPVTNPKGWETKTLETLITVQGGYAFKSGDYTDKGVPLVRIGTANKKDFDISNIVFLPTSFAGTYSRFLLSPGDMVITLTGTAGKDDYGNVNIVPDIYSKWLLNQRVAKISATSNLITKAYLFAFLSDANVKDNMISNNRGIRQGNLNNTDILTQVLPLPPIGLQEKFSEITSMIELRRMKESQQFEVSQQFFSSLTHRAFRGGL